MLWKPVMSLWLKLSTFPSRKLAKELPHNAKLGESGSEVWVAAKLYVAGKLLLALLVSSSQRRSTPNCKVCRPFTQVRLSKNPKAGIRAIGVVLPFPYATYPAMLIAGKV